MGKDLFYPLLCNVKTSTGCTPQFAQWLEGQLTMLHQDSELESDLLLSTLLSLQPTLFCSELKGYGLHLHSGSTWCGRHCNQDCRPNKECALKWLEMRKKEL